MAREPVTLDVSADPDTDRAALEHAMQSLDDDRGRLAAVDREFSTPYNREASMRLIRARMADAAHAYFEAGMELLRMSEHEPREEFNAALDDLGIGERTAERMMAVALKYQGRLRELGDRLNVSKLLELISQPDEDLVYLLNGGTVAGRKLDDIERMPRSELAQLLRHERDQRRADKEVADRMLLNKDAKINELAAKLDMRDGDPEWPAVFARLTGDVTVAGGLILQQLDKLAWAREQIALLPQSDWPEQDQRAAAGVSLHLLDTAETCYADFSRLIADLRELFGGYAIARAEDSANAPEPADADQTAPTRLQ